MRLLSPVVEVTSSLSNLLKAGLVKNDETRVIDYNAIISEKLQAIREQLGIDEADNLIESDGSFVEGIAAQAIELEPQPDPQEILDAARTEAEEILARARAEAEQLIAQAQTEADTIRVQAQEQGRQEGYAEGTHSAQQEYSVRLEQLEQEEAQRQEEYDRRIRELEPELAGVIMEIVSKVVCVTAESKKDIIFHLVEKALEHIESSRQFLIHVSKEDYPYVAEQKEALLSGLPQNTELDIIKDVTLTPSQCMIETDGGVFDCSLGTQLEGLKEDIKALSIQ